MGGSLFFFIYLVFYPVAMEIMHTSELTRSFHSTKCSLKELLIKSIDFLLSIYAELPPATRQKQT